MPFRNYTADEYRKAGRSAGPFALEGNPNHNYRENRDRGPGVLGGVMHITVGMSDYELPDVSAEGTTRGGMTWDRQASWHVCLDSDGIIPAIRDEWTAWCAGVSDIPAMNDVSLNMEIGTGSTDWRKKPAAWVARTLRNAAVWWAPRVIRYGIPLRVENDRNALIAAIKAGRKFGFTSHKIVAPHNRTDPGWVDGVDTFPWSQFFTYLREEVALLTNPEEDMPTVAEFWDHAFKSPTDGEWYTAESFLVNGNVKAGNALAAATTAVARINNVDADLAGLTAIVKALAAETPIDVDAVLAAARDGAKEGAKIDVPALAAALGPLLPSVTDEQLQAALRAVLGSLDEP